MSPLTYWKEEEFYWSSLVIYKSLTCWKPLFTVFTCPFFFVSGCFFRPISLREFFAKKTRQLLIPWAFFAFLLFAYLFVLKLNETHNWAKAISLPVTSMFDGFLGDENSFILFHVIWFLICLFEVSFVYLLIHKITPTIKH